MAKGLNISTELNYCSIVKVIVRIASEQTLSRKGYGHKARKRAQNEMGEEGKGEGRSALLAHSEAPRFH